MARITTNMGLTGWDLTTDLFNHTALNGNWTLLDAHDHTSGKGTQIPTGGIANAAITNAKVATNAVGTTQVIDAAVTTAKIADLNVTTGKLADLNVTTGKMADASVTTAKIANNAVTDALLAVGAAIPVGTVLDWWRPSGSAASPPSGFAVCDGSTVTAGNHSFPVGGSVTLPDLRNQFVLGANVALSDGTTGTAASGAANAPGIRGSGGAHAVTLGVTQIPSHSHSGSGTSNGTSVSLSHSHNFSGATGAENSSLAHNHGLNYELINPPAASGHAGISSASSQPKGDVRTIMGGPSPHTHNFSGTTGSENSTLAHTHTFSYTTDGGTGGGLAHENRPGYYGLLKIMKVKTA